MKRDELIMLVTDFSQGLLKKEKIKHSGNCLVMSQILHSYLSFFWGIPTMIINVKVKEGKKKINHYCLLMESGEIIDATASQFTDMPKVFIGDIPKNYLVKNYSFKY